MAKNYAVINLMSHSTKTYKTNPRQYNIPNLTSGPGINALPDAPVAKSPPPSNVVANMSDFSASQCGIEKSKRGRKPTIKKDAKSDQSLVILPGVVNPVNESKKRGRKPAAKTNSKSKIESKQTSNKTQFRGRENAKDNSKPNQKVVSSQHIEKPKRGRKPTFKNSTAAENPTFVQQSSAPTIHRMNGNSIDRSDSKNKAKPCDKQTNNTCQRTNGDDEEIVHVDDISDDEILHEEDNFIEQNDVPKELLLVEENDSDATPVTKSDYMIYIENRLKYVDIDLLRIFKHVIDKNIANDKGHQLEQVALEIFNKILIAMGKEKINKLCDFREIYRDEIVKAEYFNIVNNNLDHIFESGFSKHTCMYYQQKTIKHYHLSVLKGMLKTLGYELVPKRRNLKDHDDRSVMTYYCIERVE